MCPACLTTMVPISLARPERAETRSFPMITAGTTSTGNLTALAVKKLRDLARQKNRPTEYNYRDKAELIQKGETYFTEGESHGLSVFLRDGESLFHTYSTYARGTDLLAGTYNYLDLTALGRQEDWE